MQIRKEAKIRKYIIISFDDSVSDVGDYRIDFCGFSQKEGEERLLKIINPDVFN